MGIRMEDLPARAQEQIRIKSLREEAARNQKKQSKYRNEKCELDDIKFDSKKEMRRYTQLKAMLLAGEIRDLHIHEKFNLQRPYTDAKGRKVEKIDYIADFTYVTKEGEFVVEDVKSRITASNSTYLIKKKLMENQGYFIKEI